MVDSVGLYSGIVPRKGASEPNYFSLSTSISGSENIRNNNVREPATGIQTPVGSIPVDNVLSQVSGGMPNPMRGVLPCRGEPEGIRYGRFEKEKNGYMYPQVGYARHQKRGLAIDFDKPMNLPIMPRAGFYNQDIPNALGGLPG
jgi:hypothetical protein